MRRCNSALLWALLFILFSLLLAYALFSKDSNASNIQKYDMVALVRAFVYRDGQLPKKDPRHHLIEDAARAITENSKRYDLDPALVAACIYAESSYDPKAIGFSDGETGVMQVHGKARYRCKRAGLDLTKMSDQIQCGAYWLSYLEKSVCGVVAKDPDRCMNKKDKTSCSGAMSAYISGRCQATKSLAKKVAYRFRLRRWALRKTAPLLLY